MISTTTWCSRCGGWPPSSRVPTCCFARVWSRTSTRATSSTTCRTCSPRRRASPAWLERAARRKVYTDGIDHDEHAAVDAVDSASWRTAAWRQPDRDLRRPAFTSCRSTAWRSARSRSPPRWPRSGCGAATACDLLLEPPAASRGLPRGPGDGRGPAYAERPAVRGPDHRHHAHAEDQFLMVDAALLPRSRRVSTRCHAAADCRRRRGRGPTRPRPVTDYEALIASAPGPHAWPDLDERDAAVACYTSGTTGDPKGVVYSHRSIFLHTLATLGRIPSALARPTGSSCCRRCSMRMHGDCHTRLAERRRPAAARPASQGRPISVTMIEAERRPSPHSYRPDQRHAAGRQARADRPVSFRVILSGGSAVSPALIRACANAGASPCCRAGA